MADFASIRFVPERPLLRELSADRLNSILAEIKRNKPKGERGITVRQDGNQTWIGLSASLPRGTSAPTKTHPFKLTSRQSPNNANQYVVTIEPGTINGVLPSNWSNEFTISQNQLNYVALEVTANQKRIASCTVVFESSWTYQEQEPSMWGVPSSFKVLLGMARNSQVWQIAYDNLSFAVAKRLVTEKTSLQPGELPYNNWYVWQQQVGNA